MAVENHYPKKTFFRAKHPTLCNPDAVNNAIQQEWKPDYLALECQFRCVETQMSGFSFGLVSRLLKNRFQFCLHVASVSGF